MYLTMLPACDGDCLLLQWGNPAEHSILVDLGRSSTYRAIRDTLAAIGTVELFVVSHVDADHIAGTIPMVREASPPLQPKRVWFNGYRSIRDAAMRRQTSLEAYGPRQGDLLTRGMLRHRWACNQEFASGIVSVDSKESQSPIELAGGLTVQLLAPDDKRLERMLPAWRREVERVARESEEEAGDASAEVFSLIDVNFLARKPYTPDVSPANGSSIALLIERSNKRLLLAADTTSEALEEAIARRLKPSERRMRIDLLKVSHHGSRSNTSARLLEMIDCTRFAFSSDGSHRHEHPHQETIARILHADPTRFKQLFFNYRQPNTMIWESDRLKRHWNYECVFPETESSNGTLRVPV